MTTGIKVLLIGLFILALVSLFAGLFFLIKDDATADNKRTMLALMTRVGFCVIALIILCVAFFTDNIRMNKSPETLERIAEQRKAAR